MGCRNLLKYFTRAVITFFAIITYAHITSPRPSPKMEREVFPFATARLFEL